MKKKHNQSHNELVSEEGKIKLGHRWNKKQHIQDFLLRPFHFLNNWVQILVDLKMSRDIQKYITTSFETRKKEIFHVTFLDFTIGFLPLASLKKN